MIGANYAQERQMGKTNNRMAVGAIIIPLLLQAIPVSQPNKLFADLKGSAIPLRTSVFRKLFSI